MSHASWEDYIAEIPVIVQVPVLCIECKEREPEAGCDHCQCCLDNLNEAAWECSQGDYYGSHRPVTDRERHQHDFDIKRGLR